MSNNPKPLTVIPSKLPKPKAVLFDLDGTLVESTLDFDFLRQHFDLEPGQDILQYLSELPRAYQDRANALIEQRELEDAHGSKSLPGALNFLLSLEQAGIPIAVITRNSREAAKIKIDSNSLPVELLISREDAKPKPHPEALLAIAESWKLHPGDCWYIGDYLYDLQAANNAGMVAGLYTGSHDEEARYRDFMHLADIVFDHYDQLLEAWDLAD